MCAKGFSLKCRQEKEGFFPPNESELFWTCLQLFKRGGLRA